MGWKNDVMVALRTLRADIDNIDRRLALVESQATDDHAVVEGPGRLAELRLSAVEQRISQLERSAGLEPPQPGI
jgi:hypothetical protein